MTAPTTAPTLQERLAATRLAQATAATASPAEQAAIAELAAKAAAAEQEDIIYQQYKSAKPSTRIVTDKGIRIAFVGFELLTTDEQVIDYLDAQIKIHGLPGITKGEALTLADRDPMATLERQLRDKIRGELEAEMLAKAKGEVRDMGATEAKGMKVAGTDKLSTAAQS